jgi:hypothetical protein
MERWHAITAGFAAWGVVSLAYVASADVARAPAVGFALGGVGLLVVAVQQVRKPEQRPTEAPGGWLLPAAFWVSVLGFAAVTALRVA